MISKKWTCNNGNWSLILGKGLVKVNINWRMISPAGWDIWVNGEKIKEAVPDIDLAMNFAIEYITDKAKILSDQLDNLKQIN